MQFIEGNETAMKKGKIIEFYWDARGRKRGEGKKIPVKIVKIFTRTRRLQNCTRFYRYSPRRIEIVGVVRLSKEIVNISDCKPRGFFFHPE